MTAFTRLWSIKSFQQQFRDLTDLSRADLLELFASLDAPATVDDVDDGTELSLVAAALVSVRNTSSVEELLDDVAEVLPESATDFLAALREALELDPEDAARQQIARVQSSTLPTLQALEIRVDFRAANDPDTGTVRLFPVLVLRLTMDEHVGGFDAAIFQVTDDLAVELIESLREADQLRSRVLDVLPPEVLAPQLRGRLWEELDDPEATT